jgi:hypothetical protein
MDNLLVVQLAVPEAGTYLELSTLIWRVDDRQSPGGHYRVPDTLTVCCQLHGARSVS